MKKHIINKVISACIALAIFTCSTPANSITVLASLYDEEDLLDAESFENDEIIKPADIWLDQKPNENDDISETDSEMSDDIIYYSDLFYAYGSHLQNDLYLSEMAVSFAETTTEILNEYITTDEFKIAVTLHALGIATDPRKRMEYITDNLGLTQFAFNDELDAANVEFVKYVCGEDMKVYDGIKGNSKVYKSIQTAVKMFKPIEEDAIKNNLYGEHIKSLTRYDVYERFFVNDTSISRYIGSMTVEAPTFEKSLYDAICEGCEMLDDAVTIVDFAKCLTMALAMQNAEMELIQDIIETQPSESILYKGMTRLKKQLRDGFVSYFADTFIQDKVYEKLWELMDFAEFEKALAGNSLFLMGKAISAIIKVIDEIIFKTVLKISYDDYTKALILVDYTNDICGGIKKKGEVFLGQFDSNEIAKYEKMNYAYLALCKASLSAFENLAKANKNHESSYLAEKQQFFDSYSYDNHINALKSYIAGISKCNRQITDFGTWNVSNGITLSGPSDKIESEYIYCPECGLKANIVQDYGKKIYFSPDSKVFIDGSLTINVYTGTAATVPSTTSVIVNGDFFYNKFTGSGYSGTSSYFYNYGDMQVNGSAKITGEYSYFFGGKKYANFENYGSFYVKDILTLYAITGIFKNDGLVKCDGELQIYNLGTFQNNNILEVNNLNINSQYFSHPYHESRLNMATGSRATIAGNIIDLGADPTENKGIFVFCGTKQQVVKGLKAYNVDVQNIEGIKYESSAHIYGSYRLNGNPLDNNGYYSYIYDGVSFDQISDYKLVCIYKSNVTLSSSFKGDLKVDYRSNLSIPANATIIIDGNLICNYTTNSDAPSINNAGRLEVTGNIEMYDSAKSKSYGYIHQSNEAAVLTVGRDLQFYSKDYSNITNGTVILNGTNRQVVKNLKAPIIELLNESADGVVFTSSINPSILFDHHSNKFAVTSDSTFVDYDGDGMKDNVDPEPTIGNLCVISVVSSDTEKGSVNTSVIETNGGMVHTVVATPTYKYYFSKWINQRGKVVSYDATYKFIAKGNDTLTAVFEKRIQPIIKSAEGGVINAPAMAVIESEVSVSVVENDGYIYTENSLKKNGELVKNGNFIMPDEPVTLTAEFVRNESYFALKEVLIVAEAIQYNNYSTESFTSLTNAIKNAEAALNNHILKADSEYNVLTLQKAINNLQGKYIVSITVDSIPVLYYGMVGDIGNMNLTVTYDNGTTQTIYGTDCVISEFDSKNYNLQTINISYDGFAITTDVTIQKRPIRYCIFGSIEPQVYKGDGTTFTPEIGNAMFMLTGEKLMPGTDFSVEYSNNIGIGTAIILVTGIGNYTGTTTIQFKIYCKHNYVVTEHVDSTCITHGFEIKTCSICEDTLHPEKNVTTDLPQSSHNYSNNTDITYTYNIENTESLDLHFSSKTQVENGYDYIYIYDENDYQIGKYTGSSLASKTITVPGNTVKIRITSDSSKTYYGFSLDSISYREVLPLKSHTYGEWFVNSNESKTIRTHICSECGLEVSETFVPAFEFDKSSFVLNGEIGLTFYAKVLDLSQLDDAYMEFTVSEKDCEIIHINFADIKPENDGRYKFTCYVNALQITETITANFHYGNTNIVMTTLVGDADGDGEVSDWDAILLQRYLAGWNVDIELVALDFDGDGEVSDWDAILFERYLAGWNVET